MFRGFLPFLGVFLVTTGEATSQSAAQQLSPMERQTAIDWFVNGYYYPKILCEFAGRADLARLQEILSKIRSEYPQAFEIAESSKEYAVTAESVRTRVVTRFRDRSNQPQAAAECASLTDQLASAYRRRRHDDLFKYFLKQFTGAS
jgi:hypothetical protein